MGTVCDAIVFGFGFSPGPPEMLLLMVIALLLYGGKLPEVARTWGKTFAEFRRSLSGIQSDINDAIYSQPDLLEYRDDAEQPNGYDESEHIDEKINENIDENIESAAGASDDDTMDDDTTDHGTTDNNATDDGDHAIDDTANDELSTKEMTD